MDGWKEGKKEGRKTGRKEHHITYLWKLSFSCFLVLFIFIWAKCANTCCTFPLEKGPMFDKLVACTQLAFLLVQNGWFWYFTDLPLTNLAKWVFGCCWCFSFVCLFWHLALCALHFTKLRCRDKEEAIWSQIWKKRTTNLRRFLQCSAVLGDDTH